MDNFNLNISIGKDNIMVKGLILLANGFEDTEAITTIDILRRAKLDLDLVSVHQQLEILTQSKMNIKAEKLLQEIDLNDYDFLVIPGGGAVFNVLSKLEVVNEVIKEFDHKKKLIAAICAAPSLLGKLGLFKNLEFTCYPSCEEGIDGIYTAKGVEIHKNYITAKSMAYTVDFALEIVSYLLGEKAKVAVSNAIYAKK